MSIDRRSFLKTTGAATVLAGSPLFATRMFGKPVSPSDMVNIGIIGTGGRGNWLGKLLGGIDIARVTACCDIIPQRLEKGLSVADPKATGYKDYRKLLEDKNIDAVIISTPLSMHYEMASDALKAGKHVYCEKTMVFREEEARKLQDEVADAALVFQVGYQHRYNPMYNRIKATILDKEVFGELTHSECYWNRNGDWRRQVFDPKWARMINWRMFREYSGGLMAELSSHQLDIVNWIKEELPAEVWGVGGIDYWKDGRETYDNIHVTFAYPSGFKAMYTCLTTNAFEGYRMKFYGTKATIEVRGEGGHRGYIYTEPNNRGEETAVDGIASATMKAWNAGEAVPIYAKGGDEEPTGNALTAFARAVQDSDTPLSNIENGTTSAICVANANQAMQKEERRSLHF